MSEQQTAAQTWEEMEPRERDLAVAECVMGWEWRTLRSGRAAGMYRWISDPESPHMRGGNTTKATGDEPVRQTALVELPAFSTDASADVRVLGAVAKWIDDEPEGPPSKPESYRYNRFWLRLAAILRSRDPYYRDTVDQQDRYYIQHYEPGDFSRAALAALSPESR
jgi:hypothetical protein